MDFSDNLKEWRRRRGLSQEELAERLELTRQSIAKWESAQSVPEVEHLLALSDILDVSVDRLLKKPQTCDGANAPAHVDEQDALVSFLLRASVQTYAAYGAESAPSRPGSHDYHYEEAPYLYIDSYIGGECFGGEEAVFREGKAIWVMNYCGRTLSERFSGDFLKEALRARPREMPFRGPLCYRRGDFTYHNRVTGDLAWFGGEEEIFVEGERVYECRYHGGIVGA